MTRSVFAALLLVLAFGSRAGPAPATAPGPAAVLAPDGEERWVPFDLTPGNQVRFAMTVDGRAAAAILDTGVSHSVLSRGFVRGRRARGMGEARAIGGSVSISWADTRVLVLGGLTRRGARLAVADVPAAATGDAGPIDLLVGRDLLAGFALDLDYPARRFRLLRSGRLPFRGLAAPLRITPTRLVPEVEMELGGARLGPVVVDTGDGAAVTVSAGAWARARLAGLPTTSAVSHGMAGPVVNGLAVVPELRLGELLAREVEVRIEPAGGFSDTIGAAGRIGSSFLQTRRVLIDPDAGRMVLAPAADVAPLRSTSGLLFGVERDRLRIVHVMRGGPAAADGWRTGEQICAVDGRAVDAGYRASAAAGWSVGDPGRRVALHMCDGARRTLMLRRFY